MPLFEEIPEEVLDLTKMIGKPKTTECFIVTNAFSTITPSEHGGGRMSYLDTSIHQKKKTGK